VDSERDRVEQKTRMAEAGGEAGASKRRNVRKFYSLPGGGQGSKGEGRILFIVNANAANVNRKIMTAKTVCTPLFLDQTAEHDTRESPLSIPPFPLFLDASPPLLLLLLPPLGYSDSSPTA
jgi:hypothetical protein